MEAALLHLVVSVVMGAALWCLGWQLFKDITK